MQEKLRAIPSIDKSINDLLKLDAALASAPRPLLNKLVNLFWAKIREEIQNNNATSFIDSESQLPFLLDFVRKGLKPRLRRVLNGTGVIVHTNLGRSILAEKACEAVQEAAKNYCTLEIDPESGERGSRHSLVSELVCELTGAEDAMTVNNNAAAVLLILDTLCKGGETIVSRGELVEIGGSFRIPDIMLKSGTMLKEVGTTNRTHPEDYRNAINNSTRAIMRVHASNFRITGFHCSVDIKDLHKLAHEYDLPLIFDLGSGNLLDFSEDSLAHEPTVREIIKRGADIVCFSGDKALGGPQAGIIAGKKIFLEKLKKNPLTRALRCDKLCLAALEATLRLYLDPKIARKEIPTVDMLTMNPEEIKEKARDLANSLLRAFSSANISCKIELCENASRAGGGSFPESELGTTLLCLYPAKMTSGQLRIRLLKADLPLLGRIEKEAFCIDPRTLPRTEYSNVIKTLVWALS